MNVIEVKNLIFGYRKLLFENLSLQIKEGDFVFISGPSSCGKTTLVKILTGLIPVDADVKVLNTNDFLKIRKKIGVVFENPANYFTCDVVKDEIAFILENTQSKNIENKVLEIAKTLEIEHLLKLEPHHLSGGEKILVALASALVHQPKILIIDGTLNMLDALEKDRIMKILKKMNKEKKMTIICTTNNMEDTLYGKKLILINKKVILESTINKAFENESIFKECALDIPFMADLSHKLKYYGLLDKTILSMDKMVNELWK